MKKTKLAKTFEFASVATDVVIMSVDQGRLKVLLLKIKRQPYENYWALPGGMVNPDESLEESAQRHLAYKASIKNIYLEQLYTFGEVNRDPLGRVVSVAYLALSSDISKFKINTSPEYIEIGWHETGKLPPLAYDHKKIINLAVARLRSKLAYTNIVYGLMPNEFTLPDLQKVYEIILGRAMDKRNFRKKILSLRLIKAIDKDRVDGAYRPAKLYKFTSRAPQIVEIL